ncbi:hypothetical protein DM01DRAFT_1117340 [Hesseltinella vesiculosa]|uniref:RNA polymerase II elongation factor ELL N-terminal domain-containing protein n=1 Tax=Hesseltinella vesiculosa TaxID=101127 RepID=A0A1X2G9K9_9FUNG|nr:hypothetical protein DM01DRAFT_1117340 [Hesseltinella vesiculosa]
MTKRKQIFSVRLNRDAFNTIMKQPQSMKMEIRPSSSILYVDERPFEFSLRQEQSTIVVYEKNKTAQQDDDDQRVFYVGDVTHGGYMRQVLSEEDKKRTRNRTEQSEKEKQARRIELLDVPGIPTPSKKYSPVSSATPTYKRKPESHLMSPSGSRIATAVASPLPSSTQSTSRLDPVALNNLRERLIHLLALESRPTDQLTQMLKVSLNDLSVLLKKVAAHAKGQWVLRPEVYKDIRIWDWSRYDDKERATVRRKAEEAYNLLKLPRHAPERGNLVQRKQRVPPKLIPPPSQTNTPTSSSTPTSSATHTATHHSPAATSSTANGVNNGHKPITTAKRPEPAITPVTDDGPKPVAKKRKTLASPMTNTKSNLDTNKKAAKIPAPQPMQDHEINGVTSSEDEEVDAHYVAPKIVTQSDFDSLCRDHQEAQQSYIQFKKSLTTTYPLYVEALGAVHVASASKDVLLKQVKAYYKTKGGDMHQWQRLLLLSRRFNVYHTKLNLMWDTIAKAYRQKKFVMDRSLARKRSSA